VFRGATRRIERWWASPALGSAAVLALFLLPTGTASTVSSASFGYDHGGYSTAPGVLDYCGHGVVASHVAWVCLAAKASGSGYARGSPWVDTNVSVPHLSGTYTLAVLGAYNLSAGTLRVSGHCPYGSTGYARIYIYWHLWIFDATLGTYVSQSNSGWIWDSGDVSCPATGGSFALLSPPLVASFNSSGFYSTGSTSYTFVSSDHYALTGIMGCTGEASASSTSSAVAFTTAVCDQLPSNKTANTLSVTGIALY